MIGRLFPLLATAVVVGACAVAVLLWGSPPAREPVPVRPAGSAPVALNLELVATTMGQPREQRMARWLNDLGVDPEDRAGLRRTLAAALPGPQASDRTLQALRAQNRQLRRLISTADAALAPVRGEHRRLGVLLTRVSDLSSAVAPREAALEQNLRALPRTLRRLRPTMADLAATAAEATPTVRDLGRTAPAADGVLRALRSFSTAASQPLQDLGRTTQQAGSILQDAAPLLARVSELSAVAAPVGRSAAALTRSLRRTGGFERILEYVYFQTLALNAYDDAGHYLRTRLVLSPCSAAARRPTAGCAATPRPTTTAGAGGKASPKPSLEATLLRRVLRGEDPQRVLAQATREPGYQALRRRIARADRLRTAKRRRAAKGALTAGTSAASTTGQDAPITIDGGLLPGAPGKDGG